MFWTHICSYRCFVCWRCSPSAFWISHYSSGLCEGCLSLTLFNCLIFINFRTLMFVCFSCFCNILWKCCLIRKTRVQTALWILHLLWKLVHLQIDLRLIILPLEIIWDRWWQSHFNLLSRAICKKMWHLWLDNMFAASYLQFRGWPWLFLLIWALKRDLGLRLEILKLTLWLDGLSKVIGVSLDLWGLMLLSSLRTNFVVMVWQMKTKGNMKLKCMVLCGFHHTHFGMIVGNSFW